MPRFFLPLAFLFFLLPLAQATEQPQSVDMAALQAYQLEYANAEPVEKIQGSPVLGQVSYQPGSAYDVSLPFAVMQRNWLVNDGEGVKAGQPVADIRGREVEHFFDEYQAAKRLFEVAERNYQANQTEHTKGIVSSPQWLTLEREYHAAALAWEHVRHLRSLLSQDKQGNVTILSPVDGILMFASGDERLSADAQLFRVIAPSAVQLSVMMPSDSLAGLSGFEVEGGQCDMPLFKVGGRLQGIRQQTWSRIPSDCGLKLGQTLAVKPVYPSSVYRVPVSAVFELHNQDYVAVREQARLRLVAVKVRQSQAQALLVQASTALDGEAVLSRSVSALQGLFMGLGRE